MTSIPWSDAERAKLRQMRENGLSASACGRLLGRSKDSVYRQMRMQGLVTNPRPAPTPEPERERHYGPRPVPKVTLPPLPSLMDQS